MANDKRFAVLIDADNISGKYIKTILDEVSNDGVATYKRIYGDWTKPEMGSWKVILLDHSIIPIQQYAYTSGKNSTDATLIIDAMDILYSGQVDGFCIVSSDSDFTRLAARLRESGMLVVGMGERKTPKAFISACSRFKYLDILSDPKVTAPAKPVAPPPPPPPAPPAPTRSSKNGKAAKASAKAAKAQAEAEAQAAAEAAARAAAEAEAEALAQEAKDMTDLATITGAIQTIISENSDEDDWVFIGTIGNLLVKRYPDFDVRNFGFKKLTPFLKSLDLFEVKTVNRDNNTRLLYVKIK